MDINGCLWMFHGGYGGYGGYGGPISRNPCKSLGATRCKALEAGRWPELTAIRSLCNVMFSETGAGWTMLDAWFLQSSLWNILEVSESFSHDFTLTSDVFTASEVTTWSLADRCWDLQESREVDIQHKDHLQVCTVCRCFKIWDALKKPWRK